MSKKLKDSPSVRQYFAESRNYYDVARTEAIFFNELLVRKNEIQASNYTIQQALQKVSTFLLEPEGRPLEILVQFDVNDPRSQEPQKLFLGTRLSPAKERSKSQITHFFCLSDGTSLLTKIHLDRDFDPEAAEKKPSPHIQTGGRIPPSLSSAAACTNSLWNEDVDKPRIPSLPVCTALLWHWAFLEYQNAEQIAPFLKAWWWSKIVLDAEKTVLKPFFDDGSRFMSQGGPNSSLLNAFYEPVNK